MREELTTAVRPVRRPYSEMCGDRQIPDQIWERISAPTTDKVFQGWRTAVRITAGDNVTGMVPVLNDRTNTGLNLWFASCRLENETDVVRFPIAHGANVNAKG